jgi:membrane-associated phospholipid phosphatase
VPGTTLVLVALLVAQSPAPTESSGPPQDRAPVDQDRPITHLFQNLVTDIVRLPSIGSATILGIGAGGTLAVRPTDDNLHAWAVERGEAGYTSVGRRVGDGWVQGGAALATYSIGLLAKDRETTHIGSDLVRAQVLNAVITRATKAVVGRKRPGGSHDSFPSGHSSATFATAAVLANHYGWEAGVPIYAVASFVAWTRIRDQSHWASDVVMGATVGIISGYTVTRGHRDRGWAVIPLAGPRSASLSFVRLPRQSARRR